MKKIALSVFLFFTMSLTQIWSYTQCTCQEIIGETLVIVSWNVEGGCCSGVAVQGAPGGSVASYEPNSTGTWLEVEYNIVSNEYAQTNNGCCH